VIMNRTCGSCSLCCKLLPMRRDDQRAIRQAKAAEEMIKRDWVKPEEFAGMVQEWDKPAGERCKYQKFGKGCTIYDKRPFGCRVWSCRWLVNNDTADQPRPDRCGYVIDIMPDFITCEHDDGKATNIEVVQIWIDPARPDAHRDPRLRTYLERRAQEGIIGLIRFNSRDAMTLWPPAMSNDGRWHEVGGLCANVERSDEDRIKGIANAAR
jgi:hypothetical protein